MMSTSKDDMNAAGNKEQKEKKDLTKVGQYL